ncbi:hypothetical protein GS398_19255 [Pedobacter sp. HMF7056]|uniref:O-antigen ligase domain-containing protein n=2 Tax=Hufsiella ginkgonis TaxID=2695274 RepID=A0A7K1Y2F2_9SPHI|nr:hypothetical protein [Hufsiella ginkgonis]
MAVDTSFFLREKTGQAIESLKRGVWIYLLLLIFEGALRKWFLPRLAAPLLVVRDPLAIWMLFVAWKHGIFKLNWYIRAMITVSAISLFTTLIVGHRNIVVAAFGARILILHWPLMFLIGRVLERKDLIQMGKVWLLVSIPMLLLIMLQFYSPQSALINRGVGGDVAGAGFSGALGYYRPPGTFSFTTGNAQFFSVTGMFVAYFWLEKTNINRFVLMGASVALLAAIPFSISRTLTFQVILTGGFALLAIYRKPKYWARTAIVGAGLFFTLVFLNKFEFFQNATAALTVRYDSATEGEGGLEGVLGNRFLGGLLNALFSSNQPFFGYGMGMGTNAGAKLMMGNVDFFLIAEEDWARLVGEMGSLLGISVIVIRLRFCYKILTEGYKWLRENDMLPWILLSFAIYTVATGQWAQPTALGFSTLIGGWVIASLKGKETEEDQQAQ